LLYEPTQQHPNFAAEWQARMSNANVEQDPAARGIGAERRRRELRALLLAAADTARAHRQHVAITEYLARSLGRLDRDRAGAVLSAAG
jgi:hypothetical protein